MSKTQMESIINRLKKLEAEVFSSQIASQKKKNTNTQKTNFSLDMNFSLNERAFVNRYISGKSGPSRFTLLLAYMTKGEKNKTIPLSDLKNMWDKMSGKRHLGKFNRFYPNEAKNRGWVNTSERGSYVLADEWENSYAK